LYLDTGHYAYRGGGIPYLHLKNVDDNKQKQVEKKETPFAHAVELGMFCEASRGIMAFPALTRLLHTKGYDGPATVEQDMVPTAFDKPLPISRSTRAYLQKIGLGQKLGEVSEWPYAIAKNGGRVDLSTIRAQNTGQSRVVFLKKFEQSWCALVNWDTSLMPFAYMWQETGGSQDSPHFGKSYTTGLEPSSSLFGHGLVEAIEKTHAQLTLQNGKTRIIQLIATMFADVRSVKNVHADGQVEFGA
jgi:hypothetical protein